MIVYLKANQRNKKTFKLYLWLATAYRRNIKNMNKEKCKDLIFAGNNFSDVNIQKFP